MHSLNQSQNTLLILATGSFEILTLRTFDFNNNKIIDSNAWFLDRKVVVSRNKMHFVY